MYPIDSDDVERVLARNWKCGAFEFSLEYLEPLIMGIVNVTPDSFSDGGEYLSQSEAVDRALFLVEAGARIIDVGGESTRPGAEEVDVDEELGRVLPVVSTLASRGIAVSIDTRHAQVAAACIEAGAAIVNDVSGFRDPAMVEAVASSDVGLIVMHMAGEPSTMGSTIPAYDDCVGEVCDYLLEQAAMLEAAGIERERICIDPGPGFGKTAQNSWDLLNCFEVFARTGYASCAAFSRKGFVGEYYGGENPKDRLLGSLACAMRATFDGASVLRVHDVIETLVMLEWMQIGGSRALISLGSNMGDRMAAIREACLSIAALPLTQIKGVSSIFESEPAYFEDQDPFANAVCEVYTFLSPLVLLAELQRIEKEAGRVRSFPNAPRPLDLDIIDFEGVTWNSGDLVLPHPRALERDFVVTPLLELLGGNYLLGDGTPVNTAQVTYGRVTGTLGSFNPLEGTDGR